MGGLYFLFSIIFLIDIYDESLKKSLTNFLSFNSSEILKQTIKIMLIGFVLLTTIMISNLDRLSEIENKMFKWWIKLPEIMEHPFNKNLK